MSVVTVTPLERTPTADLVAEHIRRLIFQGELRPGDRIPIDTIASDLGVSRLPVREAVQSMARDGVVEARAHHGSYVGDFDEQSIRDHFEIIGLTHGLAAARLAERPDCEVLDRLGALVGQLALAENPVEVNGLVVAFHREINAHSGSSRLRAVLRAMGRLLPTGFFADVEGGAEIGRRGSIELLDAIRAGEPDRVRVLALASQRARAELVIAHLVTNGVIVAASHTADSTGGHDG